MREFMRSLIRPSAFLRAEIAEVLRQPRLVLTLVLGPFLILLLFGLGYRNEPRALRTLFVAPPGSPLAQQIQQYATSMGPSLVFAGITANAAEAKQRLADGEVDIVAVAPANPGESIRQNQQATFQLYHNEIDPLQVEYVRYFGQIYVEQVNRRLVQASLESARQDAGKVQQDVHDARASAAALREALDRGDAAAARQNQSKLNGNVSALELALGAGLALAGEVDRYATGTDGGADSLRQEVADLRQNTDALNDLPDNESSYGPQAQRARIIEADLAALETKLNDFQQIDTNVLLSPFRYELQGIANLQPRLSDFFAPAVIVLLLQHLAITFAALSIVRERQLGTMELFRVSPLSAVEMLIGKYLSYLVFAGVLAAILTALVVLVLRVPMLGAWPNYVAAVAALLFTSLGIGFVISLISNTDSQAVQYSMIVLLTSVFFSGFFLSLNALWAPVRTISWMLPATYGILLLQDIMLRGVLQNPFLLGALAAIGVGFMLLALLLLRRQMARD